MSGPAQRLRGLMALLAILALLGGVPYALWTWGGGAPWPSSAPSSDWLTESLDTEQIMGVLVAVLWLAWAHFAVCLVVELVQGRQARPSHVPGGGVGTQSLARRLVASAMLLVGSAAVAMPTASAATSDHGAAQHQTITASVNGSGGDATQTSRQTSQQTSAQTQQGKERATTVAELQPGMAVKTSQGIKYEVQPPHNRQYDCLWDIAERYLDDGLRWKEIYQLNKDVVQPDGSALKDPDLIYPGWILKLPDDAKGPGIVTIDDRTNDTKQLKQKTGDDKQNQGPDHDRDTLARDGADQQAGGDATGGGSGGSSEDEVGDWVAPVGVGGGLVAAGLLFALRRRHGWQGGGPGGGGGLKPGDEVNLRLAANGPGALLVNRSLRQVAHTTYQAGQSVPPIRAVYVNEQAFTVAFSTPATMPVPDGWRATPDGRMWTADRAVADSFDPPAGVATPCPALTTVGSSSDGTVVMLNLASAQGIIALTGALPTAYEVMLSAAAELTTGPWTDQTRIGLVGFQENLTDLAPTRIQHIPDVDAALTGQQANAAHILLLARPPSPEQERRLAAAIAQGQMLGAAVVGDTPGAVWRLDVTPDGRMTSPPLGVDVAAQRVPVHAVGRLVELFRWADAGRAATAAWVPPQPVPGFDSRMLERGANVPVSVRLLGPIRIDAPGDIEAARVDLATEIVTYIAVHPSGVHPSVLKSAIWPRGVEDEVFASAIGHTQQWLGQRSDGGQRLFQDDQQRWRLDLREVRVDWHVVQALIARAERADDPTMDLAAALSCVEGPVFDELPAHRYSWLANTSVVRDMQTTVVGVALRVSSVTADAGNLGLAHESLRSGLDMVPACEELWRAELRLTHRHDGPEATRRVADETFAAIARHGSPRGAEPQTTALVDELLPDYGRVPAGKIA